jgi:hypothetical protein
MKQQLLTLSAITVLLAQCSKQHETFSTTENNHFLNSGLTHFTPTRLFTQHGEVLMLTLQTIPLYWSFILANTKYFAGKKFLLILVTPITLFIMNLITRPTS